MKKTIFSIPSALGLNTLCTFLTGVGCVYPLSRALGLTAPLYLILLCCGMVTLLFALLDCVPRLHALSYPALFACIAALVIYNRDQAASFGAAMTLLINGQPLALIAYSRTIVMLLALLFTGVGASLARSDQAFFPLALLTIALLFCVSFLGANVAAASLLPLMLSLLLSSRAPGISARRIVPLGLLVLLLTVLLLPHAGSTLPELSRAAGQVRQTIDDYLFFTDARTTFSLTSTGFQPLGANRLGGPADPQNEPVMQVNAAGRILLRGVIKNEYTGNAWADTTSGRRYLFVNPRFAALRRDLFDQRRPESSLRESLLDMQPVTVTLRAELASTLYLTQRFSSPSGRGIVPYFSPASEVFATRNLQSGDTYTFSGAHLGADTPGVREAVIASAALDDPYLETVRNVYLTLPQSVEPSVYVLAREISAQAANDYDRALALCTYLQSSFPYTLDQNVPPASREFVSWFLFTEQQGYCTSFASSLAVMARAIGLPARYIEGYAAEPDADGIARVTQENAHAWVEIYFPGFGWLTFDPTPGENGAPQGGSAPNMPNTPEHEVYPTPTPSPTPDIPEDAQGQTQSPTPAPTRAPTPMPTPSPTPDHGDPNITPTPEITPSPTPSPTPELPPPDDEETPPRFPDIPPWLVLLLVLAMTTLAIVLRLALNAPAYLCAKQKSSADALLIWYRAAEQALLCMGIPSLPGEAPASYLWRAQARTGVELTRLGEMLCIARYSAHRLKPAGIKRAQRDYAALLSKMTGKQRFALYLRRLRHGLRL